MSNVLFRMSRLLFIIMMAVILVLVLLFPDTAYIAQKTFPVSNLTISFVVLGIFLIAVTAKCLWQRYGRGIRLPAVTDKAYDKTVAYLTFCLFFTEIYISYNIFCTNEWDPGGIWNTAAARARGDLGWSLGIAHYYSMYPNNLLILLLETACIKLNNEFGVFVGNYNMMSAIIVDCVTISCACYLVYKVLTLHVKRNFAFGGFLVAVVLFGLSPWMSICYSDSLGIVFPVLTYYLYAKPAKNTLRKWVNQICAVAISCVGYFLKPQCIIILIAVVLIEIISAFRREAWKQIYKPLVMIIIAGMCLAVTSNILIKEYERIGVTLDPEKKFGMTHFFMMGMNAADGGGFSQSDVDYSYSFESKEERTAANIQKGIERLQEMGAAGYAKHLARKLLTTYHDGTFSWGIEGGFFVQVVDNANTRMAPFLKSLYYTDGSLHDVFKVVEQFLWISVLLFTLAAGLIKQTEENKGELNILTLSIVGLTLFQMLFEVRARYLFLYLPVFCVLAVRGVENLFVMIQKRAGKNL